MSDERDWLATNDPVLAILTDLIEELREAVNDYPPDVFPDFPPDDPAEASPSVDRISGVAMRHAWTRAAKMAARAEARLRGVTGDA